MTEKHLITCLFLFAALQMNVKHVFVIVIDRELAKAQPNHRQQLNFIRT